MNCTRKNSSTFILKVFNWAAKFVISRACSCIPLIPSNFMVVSLTISVPTRDLSAILKHFATLARNSLASSVFGIVVLMFFAIVIRINIILSLFDFSHALYKSFSSALLVSVGTCGFSNSWSAISRFSTPKWNWTCFFQFEKFIPFNMRIDEACECSETGTDITNNNSYSLH